MKIIIAGAGKAGKALVRQLAAEGHDLTVIDQNSAVLERMAVQFDAMGVLGNCASKTVLLQAGVKDADLVRDTREGQFIFYELNASVLEEMMLWLTDLKGE